MFIISKEDHFYFEIWWPPYGSTSFTPIQSKLLSILKKTGGSESQALLKKLGIKLTLVELKQELSALRHMEKIGGKRIDDQVIWQLW